MDFKQIIKTGQLELWQKYGENLRKHPQFDYLFWESTRKCNLACRHCGSDCSPSVKTSELTTNEIKKALKQIASDFPKTKITLAITGGEPLLRKDLLEVVKHANGLGYICGMVTNGTLLTEKLAKDLKKAGMQTVSISLDGLKKSHEYLRGKDVFERTIKGIENLVKNDFPMMEAITCVNPQNISELEEIYQLVTSLKLKAWRLFTISSIGRAKTNKDLFLTPKQFILLMDFIKEKRKNKNLIVSYAEDGFLGMKYEVEVRDSFFLCLAGLRVGSILVDGSISACPSLPKEFIQGNIKKDNFKEIWDTKYREFRDLNWKKKGKCGKCEQWDYCHGDGMHLWDFKKQGPSVCVYQKLE